MTNYQYLSKFMLLVILSLVLAGCGVSGGNASSASAASGPSAFRMAILLPGPIDDNGWSQTGYEGLKLVEKELGAEVAYTANVPQEESEQQKIIRQYAEDGFDFIVGHGGEYQAAMEAVAKEFPQTRFALMTGYAGNNKNLGAVAVHSEEGGYLAGVVAGLKTKTNKIAYIGGEIYPSTQDEVTGLELGIKSVNPSAEISITWVESWSDQDKAREIALAHVAAGADILAVDADIAGLAALEIAKDKGVYAIGWVQDQHELAPGAILTSVLQQLPSAMLEAATLVQQGRWEGKQYKFGVAEGVMGLAPFYGLLTPEEEELVKKVHQDMIAGKIEILP